MCIPLVDPGLNDVAVGCGIFNGRSNQGLGPLAVPLTIFVQRIENLAEQVIFLAQRQGTRVFQEQFVDHGLEDEIHSDESFAPIIGDEESLYKLAHRLPARVLFPKRLAVLGEARKGQLYLPNAIGQAFHPASLVAGLECCGNGDPPARRHLCDVGGNHH